MVVILVFMLLWGFTFEKEFKMPQKVRTAFGVIAALFVIVVLLYLTDLWRPIFDYLFSGSSTIGTNILVIVVIGIAIAAVVLGDKGRGSSGTSG